MAAAIRPSRWTYSGFITGQNAGNVTITGAANPARGRVGETVAGSPYTITCAPGDLAAANYSFATGSTGNLSITARPITVTAVAKSKVYGDADPALTFTNSSLGAGVDVNGALTRASGESVNGARTPSRRARSPMPTTRTTRSLTSGRTSRSRRGRSR